MTCGSNSTRIAIALVLAATALAAAGVRAQVPSAPEADFERIVGRWTVVECRRAGSQNEKALLRTFFLADGVVYRPEKEGAGRILYRLDPSARPKQFDLVVERDGKTRTARGIYSLRDDVLTICHGDFGGSRAIEFSSNQQNRNILIVLERLPPE